VTFVELCERIGRGIPPQPGSYESPAEHEATAAQLREIESLARSCAVKHEAAAALKRELMRFGYGNQVWDRPPPKADPT
jgi:hypothetical protein